MIITQNIAGVSLETSVKATRRVRSLNGLEFSIWDLEGAAADTALKLELRGLPSRSAWPKYATLGIMLMMLVWMITSLVQARPAAQRAERGTLSPAARRDRIVKSIEILDQDLAGEEITHERHKRRRDALMRELAQVLRELEIDEGGTTGRA